jgi:hypothetical protein
MPLSQRPAGMRAHAVEGVERAIDIEQRHDAAIGDKFFSRPRRDITRGGNVRPFRHRLAPVVRQRE